MTAFAVCYNIAAREAEAHPQDPTAQNGYISWRMSYAYLLSQSYASAATIEQRLIDDRAAEGPDILRGSLEDVSDGVDPVLAYGQMRRLCARATPHPRRRPASNAAPQAQH
jgi:hypothetical protein